MKVAVIGAGVAGLSAAWHLDQAGIDVHLVEGGLRLGGHSHSHLLPVQGGEVIVDTGFVAFNPETYASFHRWLALLGVDTCTTPADFSLRDPDAGFEYGTGGVSALVGNTKQLFKPGYWQLWQERARFFRELKAMRCDEISLGKYLSEHSYSRYFVDSYLVPLVISLSSLPVAEVSAMPLAHVAQLLRDHCVRLPGNRSSWQVVRGGSAAYLQAFETQFGGTIHTNARINELTRRGQRVHLLLNGRPEIYDAVVLACHSHQALAALADPTEAEQSLLSAIQYHRNEVYLHGDASFMPQKRSCWSSWNVRREKSGGYTVTCWLNRLQGLSCNEQFFLTFNPEQVPRRVRWQGNDIYPIMSQSVQHAQQCWSENSTQQTYFADAFWGAGRREDDFVNGLKCARRLLRDAATEADSHRRANVA